MLSPQCISFRRGSAQRKTSETQARGAKPCLPVPHRRQSKQITASSFCYRRSKHSTTIATWLRTMVLCYHSLLTCNPWLFVLLAASCWLLRRFKEPKAQQGGQELALLNYFDSWKFMVSGCFQGFIIIYLYSGLYNIGFPLQSSSEGMFMRSSSKMPLEKTKDAKSADNKQRWCRVKGIFAANRHLLVTVSDPQAGWVCLSTCVLIGIRAPRKSKSAQSQASRPDPKEHEPGDINRLDFWWMFYRIGWLKQPILTFFLYFLLIIARSMGGATGLVALNQSGLLQCDFKTMDQSGSERPRQAQAELQWAM